MDFVSGLQKIFGLTLVVPDAGSFGGDFVRDLESFPEGLLDENQEF